MKRIMIITQSLFGGGAEKSAACLSIGLSAKYDVILVSTNKGNIDFDYAGKLIELNNQSSKSIIVKIQNFINKYKQIKKLKKEYEPDVAISFLGLPNLINVITKQNEKVLLSIRNVTSNNRGRKSFLYKKLMRYLENHSDGFVTLSDFVKKDLIDVYSIREDRITTIYNICDLDNIDTNVDRSQTIEGKYIVSVGRLCQVKGQWHLIRAFKKVHELNPEYKLVIIGNGQLKSLYEELISAYGLEESVVLLGWVTKPYEIVKGAELFVFTSISEGLGNVLLEALALSKAIVASFCTGGANEVICPKLVESRKEPIGITEAEWALVTPKLDYNGMDSVTPLDDSEQHLADAITYLLDNATIKADYEKKARARAEDFRMESIIPRWENLIENVCQK